MLRGHRGLWLCHSGSADIVWIFLLGFRVFDNTPVAGSDKEDSVGMLDAGWWVGARVCDSQEANLASLSAGYYNDFLR